MVICRHIFSVVLYGSALVLSAALVILPVNANAQSASYDDSPVQIDRSVLDQFGGAPPPSRHQPAYNHHYQQQNYYHRPQRQQQQPARQAVRPQRPVLRPPPGVPVLPAPSSRDTSSYEDVKKTAAPARPTLIAPDARPVDRYNGGDNNDRSGAYNNHDLEGGSHAAIEWNGPRVSSSVTASASAAAGNGGPPVPENDAVAYPVNVKSKTRSFDTLADFEADQTAQREARRNRTKTQTEHANKTPEDTAKNIPVPPKRPSLKKAPVSFVNQARKELDMPEMTKEDIEAADSRSLISNVYKNDALGKTLTEPDRSGVLARVGKLMPAADKAKDLNDIAPAAAGSGAPAVKLHDAGHGIVRTGQNIEQAALKQEKNTRAVPPPQPPSGRPEPPPVPRPPQERSNSSDKAASADDMAGDGSEQTTPPEKDFISMPFPSSDSTKLDLRMKDILDRQVIAAMKNNPDRRLQIQAFAAGDEDDGIAAAARRLSLSRALAVREYLMAGGIDSRRIDVRALGAQTKRTPADRVDFVFFGSDNNIAAASE